MSKNIYDTIKLNKFILKIVSVIDNMRRGREYGEYINSRG